jgi:hypothetical protein
MFGSGGSKLAACESLLNPGKQAERLRKITIQNKCFLISHLKSSQALLILSILSNPVLQFIRRF